MCVCMAYILYINPVAIVIIYFMCSSWHVTTHSCPLCPAVWSRASEASSHTHSLPEMPLEAITTLLSLHPTDSLP